MSAGLRVAFAIPGDLATPTGGYVYDRRVLERLPAQGVAARVLALPGSFPRPTAEDLEATRRALAGIGADEIVLADGLAWGALPPEMTRAFGARTLALCHHPLGLETGLAPEEAQALIANERLALAAARHVLVTSETTRDTLMEDFGVPAGRVAIAEPGVARAARARGSAPGAAPLILAVGAVVPRKGYDVLVEALASLGDLDWRASIVGAHDRAPQAVADLTAQIARAGLEGRIALPGSADAATLDAIYDGADLFVCSSRYEGYGMVLAEAMTRGLPIVTTTGGAAARTVPDGAGLKVPPEDAPALAGALRALLCDAAARRRLADAAFAAGQILPTWDDCAARIAQVLRAVAANAEVA